MESFPPPLCLGHHITQLQLGYDNKHALGLVSRAVHCIHLHTLLTLPAISRSRFCFGADFLLTLSTGFQVLLRAVRGAARSLVYTQHRAARRRATRVHQEGRQ